MGVERMGNGTLEELWRCSWFLWSRSANTNCCRRCGKLWWRVCFAELAAQDATETQRPRYAIHLGSGEQSDQADPDRSTRPKRVYQICEAPFAGLQRSVCIGDDLVEPSEKFTERTPMLQKVAASDSGTNRLHRNCSFRQGRQIP